MKSLVLTLTLVSLCGSVLSLPPPQQRSQHRNNPIADKPNPARNLYHALFVQGAQREGIAYNDLGPNTKHLWDQFLDFLTERTKKTPMMDMLMALQGLQSISLKNPGGTIKQLRISDKHNQIALDVIRDFVQQVEKTGMVHRVGMEREFREFQQAVMKAKHIRELADLATNESMSIMGLMKVMKKF